MADIALRSYLEEIDGLIDGNRVEEAIAHLKHILGIYPKDLDAYRLLAKALLEKNRHLDAADVFQRVLSSVPDDFIAHIGMAVVREDEGNLDAAIWHMERAYEVQPSSQPIQEELRRLFGKRDGGEPPRLRLSRAALARMYEKGDLYQQAIGELRAALRDDPDRLDLKVMLASALWRSKQRAEAAETSAKLLEILPFCKEANRILASVWTESGRPQEAQNYRRRLEALDPYEAFADPAHNGHGVGMVDPDQVVLPHLENVYGETSTDANRPDWMEALGIQYDQASPTQAATSGGGEWLDTLTGQNETRSGSTAPGNEPVLPGTDWLSSLRGEDQPVTGSLQASQNATPAPATSNADTPDWLSGLGISDATLGIDAPSPAIAGGTDWLTEMMGGESGAPSQPGQGSAQQDADVPAWMSEDVAASRPAPTANEGTGMTGWLSALSGEPEPEATARAATSKTPRADDTEVPDWLQTEAGAQNLAPTQPAVEANTGDVPDWLTEPSSEASPATPDDMPDWLQKGDVAATEMPASEIPDWSKAANAEAATTDVPDWLVTSDQTEPAPRNDSEVPDWLAGAGNDSLENAPVAPLPTGDLPDWLAGTPAVQPEKAASLGDVSDWLTDAAELGAAPPAVPVASEPIPAQLPDWLSNAAPTPEAAPEDIPAWLNSDSTAPADSAPEVPGWLNTSPPAPLESVAEMPDWLAAPTTTQDSVEVKPELSKPEEQLSEAEKAEAMAKADEEMPEWMKAAGWIPRDPSIPLDSGSNLVAEAEEEPVADDSPEPAEVPDWLKAMKPPEEAKPARAAGDAPDWLRHAMEGGEPAQSVEQTAEPEAAQPITADDLPDWLKSSAGDPTETVANFLKSQPVAPLPAADLPDWLQESAASADAAAETEPGSAPDWRMANEISEATRTESLPESRDESESPSWLKSPARDTAEAVATYLREQAEPPPTLARPEAEVPAQAEPAASISNASPDDMSEDEALAWLEGLAAKHGANEEELVTKPEDRPVMAEANQTPAEPEATEIEPATDLPDWLKAPVDEQPTPVASTVPDWMRAPADENPVEAETPAGTGNTESPDWLSSIQAERELSLNEMGTKPIAPREPVDRENSAFEIEEPSLPDWLTASLPVTETPAETTDSQITRPIDLFAATPAAEPASMSDDEALAWLEGLAAKQGANEEELVTKPEDRPASEADFTESLGKENTQPELPSELPAWLEAQVADTEVGAETPPATTEDAKSAKADIQPHAVIDEPVVDSSIPASQAATEMSADEALAWLEGLAAKQGAAAEELVSRPETRAEETPAWVQNEASLVEASTAQTAPLGDASGENQDVPTLEELPGEPEAVAAAPAIPAEKPDWLKQMEAESDEYEALARGELPAQPETPATPEMSEDEALAWLEGLAAKQGASAEELVSRPESRAAEMPAWVKHEAEAAEVEAADAEEEYTVIETVEAEPEAEAIAAEEPGEGEQPEEEQLAVEEVAAETEKPDWLTQMESEADTGEIATEPPAAAETEELPAWLTVPASTEPDEPLTIAGWTPLTSSEPEPQESEIIETPTWMRATETPDVTLVEIVSQAEPEVDTTPAPAKPEPRPKPEKPAKKAKAPRKAARRSSRATKLHGSEEPATVLATARQHLAAANVGSAVDVYSELINSGHFTPEIIDDLEAANLRNPGHPELLRTLGDAYMRDNQLQKALDSYKQALQQL